MFARLRQWWSDRIIRQSRITPEQWQEAVDGLPLFNGLDVEQLDRLIKLATLFLHEKSLEGAHDLVVDDEMRLQIALQACLPVLNLGLEWYSKWSSVIIYPDTFRPKRTYIDDNGIVHHEHQALGGESWQRGPVILSWTGVQSSRPLDGYNLVIHEFVHKLDMRNGVANGFPPLHANMSKSEWTDIFQRAYTDLNDRIQSGKQTVIDGYAATSPAEFFAVLCEVFFEQPGKLIHWHPDVYAQLALFFRQEPHLRLR